MTDAVVETLRLRGPGATRLSRIAATTLPAALDRALAGLPAGRVDAVAVQLDLDPHDYDDVTLAIVWADAIRAELVRHLPHGITEDAAPDAVAESAQAGRSAPLTLAEAAAAARGWLASAPVDRVVPADALALAELVSRTPGAGQHPELAALLLSLAAAIDAPGSAQATAGREPQDSGQEWSEGAVTVADRLSSPGHAPRATQPPASTPALGETGVKGAESVGHADAAQVSAAAARIAALAALAEPEAQFVNLDAVTQAAGLALLYPWLADVCRAAVDLHPGLDEAAVRAHALAAVVDPDDPTLLADPLVTFLAGVLEPLPPQMALPHAEELRDNAERTLAAFASLLPGFGESSREFIRSEWIRRTGLLDADLDAARLTAATHPLDVVLGRLPYPLGMFKLPWSPPLMVRFRP